MTPRKTDGQSRRSARVEQFEFRTEADPLGALQPDTEAEFTASGRIPRGQESTTHYVTRIGPAGKGKRPGRRP